MATMHPIRHDHVHARQSTSSMDWFYRILDVEYGVELAVLDARRATTWQGATFSIIINVLLGVAFLGVWLRYDLWSTLTVFAPVKDNILTAVPEGWALVRTVGGFLLGLAAAFFTSLIQWAYPRIAQHHDAALWGLAGASLFDIATDYRDVQADFPTYATGLLEMAGAQSASRWLIAGVICIIASFILARQRSLLWVLAVACFASTFLAPREVWTWGIVFLGTIFSSFVAQSLLVIHVAKVLALITVRRDLAQQIPPHIGA